MKRPMSDDEIDAIVRDRLEKRAEAIDPRPYFTRIRGVVPPAPVQRKFRYRSRVWGMAAAAVILIGIASLIPVRPAEIAAESIVRETQAAHRLPLDRCYLVEMRREPGSPSFPARPEHTTVRLWTRGDRFFLDSSRPGYRGAWGRDENGGVWLTAQGGRLGARLDPDEIPPWLSMHCDMNSLQLDTMLDELLGRFELQRSQGTDTPSPTLIITAIPRRGVIQHPLIRKVVLEIDSETRVLRRAVVSRGRFDQLFATTTYTLIDSEVQDDERYRIEGHLQPDAEILSRTHQPGRRHELLGRFFGQGVDKWLKPMQKLPS